MNGNIISQKDNRDGTHAKKALQLQSYFSRALGEYTIVGEVSAHSTIDMVA